MTKNHFVPQFYLKGFIDPASKDLHNPYLWVVDLQDRIVMKKGPENVARIVGFYDWDELGDIAPSIEDIYSKIESRAAPVVARIRNNDFHMTMGDRYNLSIFIGFQISRTPFARSLVIDRIKNSGQEKLHEIVRNEVEFREKLDNYLKSKNGESELTFEYIKNLVEENKLQVIPKRDNVLGTTLSMGLIFAEKVFLNSYWLFVLATGGACYFTSDHPVSIGKPSGNALKGRKNLEFEIAIPISPSCFLLLHQYEFIDVVEGVDYLRANEVYEINKLMLRVADRYVFCSSEEIGMWVLETKQRLFSQM